MIHVEIPGFGERSWTKLLLDLNGTLTTDGVLIAGLSERLRKLSAQVEAVFCTAAI